MEQNAGTHTECTYFDGRIELATQLVMYMKDIVRGMGNTCYILTGCPIKRFGTSSPDPLLRHRGQPRFALSCEFEYT